MTLAVPRLLLITDPALGTGLIPALTAALAGGARHVLVRDKGRAGRELASWAAGLLPVIRSHGGFPLLHGQVDLALELDAAGVHLPESGLDTTSARRRLGEGRLLGRSCHEVATARAALAAGADYVTLSPVFPTRSHPGAEPLGLERFARMAGEISGPVLALGGIDGNNAGAAIAHGAAGVALIRGILAAAEVEKTTRDLLRTLAAAA